MRVAQHRRRISQPSYKAPCLTTSRPSCTRRDNEVEAAWAVRGAWVRSATFLAESVGCIGWCDVHRRRSSLPSIEFRVGDSVTSCSWAARSTAVHGCGFRHHRNTGALPLSFATIGSYGRGYGQNYQQRCIYTHTPHASTRSEIVPSA
eukprot:3139448-Prymnesium_polylepis.2